MTRELQDKLLALVDGIGAVRPGDGNNIRGNPLETHIWMLCQVR